MSRNIGIGEVRTKLLDTDHKQWNCGMGLYDPNKVFFKEDPNGKVIVDGKLCIIVRSKSESNLVMIGDKFYKFVVIGDQIWLAENLELPFDNATYYNGDPAQSYGLLYRGRDMGALNDYLLENNIGWHVPTVIEIQELIAAAGTNPGTHLKSTTSWDSGNGDNSTEFDMKAAGLRVPTNYGYKGTNGSMWACVPDYSTSTNSEYRLSLGTGTLATINFLADGFSAPVRLIKDTEPLLLDGKIYKTALIGDRIWTIENLDYKIPGIAYNVTTIPEEPACWDWNNGDAPLKEKGGMYYNAYAAKYINDNNIIPGWHAAYGGEMEELVQVANTSAPKLRNLTGWENVTDGLESPSTNDFRFNAIPAGNRNTSNPPAFVNQDSYALIYTCTFDATTPTNAYRLNLNRSNGITYTTTTAKNGLSLRLVKDTEPVEVGGKKYKTQKVGDQLWMTENLDFIFEGLNVGGELLQEDVHAWYYNNNKDQSNGLLYNGYAAVYLSQHPELLPEGWRIPTYDDISTLLTFVGSSTGGTKLKTQGDMQGIDFYGFHGDGAGFVRSTGVFDNRNTILRCWSSYVTSNDYQTMLSLEDNNAQARQLSINVRSVGYSIRLVKDLTTGSLAKGGNSNSDVVKEIDEKELDKVDEEIKNDETIENKR